MSTFQFDHFLVLNQHAERLKTALYNVNKKINDDKENPLQTKEIDVLCKAIKDGKTMDQEKFPHLSKEKVKSYGSFLRTPFAVLNHYQNFQGKAIDALRDVLNESKNFDINWNYIYIMPVIQLFVNYCQLNFFVNSIDNLDRVVMVYGYCYYKNESQECPTAPPLLKSIIERKGYKILDAELQQVHEKFRSLFKSIIAIVSRLLKAGSGFTWKELNLIDNPNPADKDNIFVRPEYLIMQNMKLITDAFVYFCIVCGHVLHEEKIFADVFIDILAHSTSIHISGSFIIDIKRVIQDFSKVKQSKKAFDMSILDSVANRREDLSLNRAFRQRKLTMILREYISAAQFNFDVLLQKLPIIQAILGWANFEMLSELFMCHLPNANQNNSTLIALIDACAEAVVLLARNKEEIARFLIYNFREYDGPFLDTLIHSFTIPNDNFRRLTRLKDALKSVDISVFDNGTRYELSGLDISLLREMSSFNSYSRSRGVIHLAPLFTLISSIYTRVHLYVTLDMAFLNICNLHHLWGFNNFLLNTIKGNDPKNHTSEYAATLYYLSHFYQYDENANAEVSGFKDMTKKFLEVARREIDGTISSFTNKLQVSIYPELFKQTKPSVAIAAREAKENQRETVTAKIKLSEISVGHESLLTSRRHLSQISMYLDALNSLISRITCIGSVSNYGERIDVLDWTRKSALDIFTNSFSQVKFNTPFEAAEQLHISKIIFQHVMNAALMDYTVEYDKIYNQITNVTIKKDEVSGIYSIDTNDIGFIAKQFMGIYQKFLDTLHTDAYFSNTSQMFLSNDPNNSLASMLASQSAIRNIYEIIGAKGIAMIDILAADTFMKLVSQLQKIMSESKYSDLVVNYFKSNSGKANQWLKSLAQDPAFEGPAGKCCVLLNHLGAIARFRRLLRSTINITKKEALEFPYLLTITKPENDIILNARLKDHKIFNDIGHERVSQIFGSFLISIYWYDIHYDVTSNAFTNNGHLFALGLESIVGALVSFKKDLNAREIMKNFIGTVYYTIPAAHDINSVRTKKGKWPRNSMIILIDHIVQNSIYIDYSISELVIPYSTIRHVYTSMMTTKTNTVLL